ncbi:RhoGAP domain-containing protein [Providencia sp. PROV036]|uniref:RhoGAP domain-containing protein n=1 Tax=Providencia sp. PROV036 TaxID=2949767 RepID=UPI002349A72E|nr:RhoGAP domain-containing protein [Providencia sp. PROV036]
MAQSTVKNRPKPQLSAYSPNETNLAGNKANSNFKSFLKRVTPSFISFFSLLFNCHNKSMASPKKVYSDENFVIISPICKKIPVGKISSADDGSTKVPSTQNEIIPKEGLTGNPRVDAARKVALQVIARHKAQRAEKTRKNEVNILQDNNKLLIDNYDGLSDIDREKNHMINQLGHIILSHKEYSNSQGILRVEGAKSDVDNIIKKINGPDYDRYYLSQLHDYSLPALASVFKRMAGELLKKNSNIDFSSPISFKDLQACDDAIKNKENITQQIKSSEQLKNKAPTILKNTDFRICKTLDRLAPPPLTLQLVTRFCALIANNENSHKMSVKSLATIFAAHLTDIPSLDLSTIKDAKKIQLEIMKAKEANQLAESYIAALIHRERSLFHHT